jgi:hypothetical protein
VLTDSGGIQEETTFLGVPCFTLRDNTERPVTVRAGTNTVLGLDPARIARIPSLLHGAPQAPAVPPEKWDGRAANGSPMSSPIGSVKPIVAASPPDVPAPRPIVKLRGVSPNRPSGHRLA